MPIKRKLDEPAPPIEVKEDGTVVQGDIIWQE